jgi:hypothetical protein
VGGIGESDVRHKARRLGCRDRKRICSGRGKHLVINKMIKGGFPG